MTRRTSPTRLPHPSPPVMVAPGWASRLFSGTLMPADPDADPAAFRSSLTSLAIDLDRTWTGIAGRDILIDERLVDDLRGLLVRVADGYRRESETAEPRWARVARARSLAWGVAADAFSAHMAATA